MDRHWKAKTMTTKLIIEYAPGAKRFPLSMVQYLALLKSIEVGNHLEEKENSDVFHFKNGFYWSGMENFMNMLLLHDFVKSIDLVFSK